MGELLCLRTTKRRRRCYSTRTVRHCSPSSLFPSSSSHPLSESSPRQPGHSCDVKIPVSISLICGFNADPDPGQTLPLLKVEFLHEKITLWIGHKILYYVGTKSCLKGGKTGFFVNIGQFPFLWTRIRIPTSDPDPQAKINAYPDPQHTSLRQHRQVDNPLTYIIG